MLVCKKCGLEMPEDQFYRAKNAKGRLYSSCKKCINEKNSKWQKENKLRRKQIKINYKRRHLERHKELNRGYSKNHRAKYPDHSNARWEVCNAVKEGRLKKLKWCQCCGKEAGEKKVEAHHASYEKKYWLDVVWLCKEHHRELHEWIKNQKR